MKDWIADGGYNGTFFEPLPPRAWFVPPSREMKARNMARHRRRRAVQKRKDVQAMRRNAMAR